MSVETVESVTEDPSKRVRSGIGVGSGSNGGSGRGGPGGDGSNHPPEGSTDTFEKATVLTWFLLLVVLMTFGGLCAAYIVTATNNALEWRPFSLPTQVWISTIIIVISSLVYHKGKIELDSGDRSAAKKWLSATVVLGAAFISSQLLAWLELYQRGLYFSGNPYAGFFYVLTAVHVLHVFGGVIALGTVVLATWRGFWTDRQFERTRSIGHAVGLYWHFMGGVWIVLFLLLGFWT